MQRGAFTEEVVGRGAEEKVKDDACSEGRRAVPRVASHLGNSGVGKQQRWHEGR